MSQHHHCAVHLSHINWFMSKTKKDFDHILVASQKASDVSMTESVGTLSPLESLAIGETVDRESILKLEMEKSLETASEKIISRTKETEDHISDGEYGEDADETDNETLRAPSPCREPIIGSKVVQHSLEISPKTIKEMENDDQNTIKASSDGIAVKVPSERPKNETQHDQHEHKFDLKPKVSIKHRLKRQGDETAREYLNRIHKFAQISQLSDILGRSGAFWDEVRHCFLQQFDFSGVPLDYSLRMLCMKLPMPREGQQIDRVIYAFGRRYHACNPKVFNSEEAPYFLGFALVVLNTAMWKKSMAHQLIRKDQFTQQFKNLEDMDQQVTPVYLEAMYYSVKRSKIDGMDTTLDRDCSEFDWKEIPIVGQSKQKNTISFEYKTFDGHPLYAEEVGVEFDTRTLQNGMSPKIETDQRHKMKKSVYSNFYRVQKWKNFFQPLGYDLVGSVDMALTGGQDDIPTLSSQGSMFADARRVADDQSILSRLSRATGMASQTGSISSNCSTKSFALHRQPTVKQSVRRSISATFLNQITGNLGPNQTNSLYHVISNDSQEDLTGLDLRRLFLDTDTFGLDVAGLHSLLYHAMNQFPLFLSEKNSGNQVVLRDRVSALLDDDLMAEPREDLFPFIINRLRFADNQSPILLHQGPLIRKKLFLNTDFKTTPFRRWRGYWCCIVLCPKSIESRSHATGSQVCYMQGMNPKLSGAELWIFSNDSVRKIERWMDKSYCIYKSKIQLARIPEATTEKSDDANDEMTDSPIPGLRRPKNRSSNRSFGLPPLHGQPSAPLTQEPVGQVLLPGLPFPDKRISLRDTMAYVDETYKKYPDVFNFAQSSGHEPGDSRTLNRQTLFMACDSTQSSKAPHISKSGNQPLEKEFFIRRLTQGIQFYQLCESETSSNGNEEFVSSPMHHWLCHINQAAAITTLVNDVWQYVSSTQIQGRWEAIDRDMRAKCRLAIATVKDRVKKIAKEKDRHVLSENEIWIMNLSIQDEISDSVSWSAIVCILEKTECDDIVVDLAKTFRHIQEYPLRSKNVDIKDVQKWIFLSLMKLKYQSYHFQAEKLASDIELETRHLNQLDLARISQAYFQKHNFEKVHHLVNEEQTDTSSNPEEMEEGIGKDGCAGTIDIPIVSPTDINVDPGSHSRRGYQATTMRRKQTTKRSKLLEVFPSAEDPSKDTMDQSAADETPQQCPQTDVHEENDEADDDTGIVSPLDVIEQFQTGTSMNWMTRFTNKNLFEIQKQIVEKEKKLEWLRVECQKWKLYSSIVARCIVAYEHSLQSV